MEETIKKIEELGYKVTTDDWAVIYEPHISKITGKEYLVTVVRASKPNEKFFKQYLSFLTNKI